jgi:hypothetical protein
MWLHMERAQGQGTRYTHGVGNTLEGCFNTVASHGAYTWEGARRKELSVPQGFLNRAHWWRDKGEGVPFTRDKRSRSKSRQGGTHHEARPTACWHSEWRRRRTQRGRSGRRSRPPQRPGAQRPSPSPAATQGQRVRPQLQCRQPQLQCRQPQLTAAVQTTTAHSCSADSHSSNAGISSYNHSATTTATVQTVSQGDVHGMARRYTLHLRPRKHATKRVSANPQRVTTTQCNE